MKHLNKFNEHDNYCTHCNGEGREPYCNFCGKQLDYGNDKPKTYEVDEDEFPEDDNYTSSNDDSLNELVRQILDAAKLDVDAIEESDPDFIPYIADMIQSWIDKNR
jgi:hypothetical protein